MARKSGDTITIYRSENLEVAVEDIIGDIPDDQLRDEANKRFGQLTFPPFDLLEQIEIALLHHKSFEALALIENHRTVLRVPEDARAKQLAEMRMAGAA